MNWVCTSCGHHVTLGSADYDVEHHDLYTRTGADQGEAFVLGCTLLRCPNQQCQKSDLSVSVWSAKVTTINASRSVDRKNVTPTGIGKFKFLPTTATPLSSSVPAPILEDYQEAYLIRDLSPKASATLSRRALQGMIRDFWDIARRTLHGEIEALRDKCDPDLFDAMMGLKSVGNIGAHPEADVNEIIDIVDGEPQDLLDLIHLLDQEWYVARAAKAKRLARVSDMAGEKAGKKADVVPALAPGK